MIQRLVKEAVPFAFDKALDDQALQRWANNVHWDIVGSCMALCDLAIAKLQQLLELNSSTTAEGAELETDVLTLLASLSLGMNQRCEFHEHNREEKLSPKAQGVAENYAKPQTLQELTNSTASSSGDDESVVADFHCWLVYLINYFGSQGGFEVLLQVQGLAALATSCVNT